MNSATNGSVRSVQAAAAAAGLSRGFALTSHPTAPHMTDQDARIQPSPEEDMVPQPDSSPVRTEAIEIKEVVADESNPLSNSSSNSESPATSTPNTVRIEMDQSTHSNAQPSQLPPPLHHTVTFAADDSSPQTTISPPPEPPINDHIPNINGEVKHVTIHIAPDVAQSASASNGTNVNGLNGHTNGTSIVTAPTPVRARSTSGATSPPLYRAKSVSHWHDSRISVEMHLALYIEDLMLLAPGAAAEKTNDSNVVTQPVAPVAFDEDAEPDITLQHVLAGVEYLLHTRIIGSANPIQPGGQPANDEDAVAAAVGGVNPVIDEAAEDELESDEDDEKKPMNPAIDPSVTGVDEHGMPVPLASAPSAVVDAAVTSSSNSVPFPPSSLASPYFYFVSLDLTLCDDLVTALCYHMRRAEKKWAVRPKPTPEAIKALELFEGFFTYVYSFRCAVAARPTSYLRASLKVGRHLRAESSAHRRLVVRLLVLIQKECPRIEKWEDLVDTDDQLKVREILKTRELRLLQRRLDGQAARHEREDSVSRMNSFRTSREHTKDTADPHHHAAHGGSSSQLLSAFPTFYSVRHNILLPPKGACFDVEPKRLVQMFRTDMKLGLKKDEVLERQKMYGKNELPPPHQASFIRMLWDQIKDFIILVLLTASIVSAGIQDWEAAGVLFVVVVVNIVIGLVQEYRSANALKALNSFSIPQAQLLRDGEVSVEPASELVPGDIVILEEGANVPADLRLLEVSQLSTIEAILTGESLPILKSTAAIRPRGRRYLTVGDRVNMAFMSTLVSKGRGVGLVVNTGATTEVGRIYAALTASSEETIITPLQRKLATLGKWLVGVSILACAAVIGIGLGRGYGTDIIKIGISLAVSVIPEGLVTVVTLTMAIGTQRMAKKKAIARNLPAVETLGAITTICSDKTGTLTEGKMKTESMWVVTHEPNQPGHTLRFITASKEKRVGAPTSALVASDVSSTPLIPSVAASVSVLLNEKQTLHSIDELPVPLLWNNLVCCLNNNAAVKMQDVVGPDGTISQEEVMVGDATEIALLRATQQAHCGLNYWTTTYGLKRALEFAFDSDRKRMSVILDLPAASGENATFLNVARPPNATHILLVKGAPEAVLTKSISYLSPPVNQVHHLLPFNDAIENDIETQGSVMAGKGMRVLATAFKFLTTAQVDKFKNDLVAANAAAEAGAAAASSTDASGAAPSKPAAEPAAGPSGADLISFDAEVDLAFIGLNGIMDPPRVEVADAISTAHIAGIRVCMITGDHYDTALAIAKQIGIFSELRGDRAMNGDALAVLSEEQLAALNPFPVVFSRVSPDNKLKLVKSLQRRGEICAMTGDGVNDSPAIKQADVGIAMGLGGTEVTRQSADIILSDDNFSTIVSSVGEGRRIYDNIVKFLVYLLTCNGAEVWVMLFAVILGMPVPYLSLMLLWANIFADIPPSLSLGLEEGEVDAMLRPPRPANQNILTLKVGFIILFDSSIMAIMVLVNYYHCYHIRDEEINYARTLAFELLATLHLVHSFEARSLTESVFQPDIFTSNPALGGSFLLSMTFLIGGCYVPGLNDVLELKPLHGLEWGIIFINVATHVIIIECRKWLLRTMEQRELSQRLHLAISPSNQATKANEIELEQIRTSE